MLKKDIVGAVSPEKGADDPLQPLIAGLLQIAQIRLEAVPAKVAAGGGVLGATEQPLPGC